jgi:hypothetical protein
MNLLFDARPLRVLAAHLLALCVVVSQPVASLAWLGGAHATLEQAALHQAAVEQGHNPHHGTLEHHEHQPQHTDDKTDVHFSRSMLGPGFPSAAPYAGSFQDLLQTLLQVTLTVSLGVLWPDDRLRFAALAEDVPSQHSPTVPHRPPILPLLSLAIP